MKGVQYSQIVYIRNSNSFRDKLQIQEKLKQTTPIKVIYLQTDAQESCLKRILKFTLKQFLHISVQSP